MSAVVGDPFLLASYDVPKKSRREGIPNAFVSQDGSVREGFATTAVQGDGVHVIEVSELQPAHAYSLGPSTHFLCPAVSRRVRIDNKPVLQTYAALAAPTSSSKKDHVETMICVWNEHLEGSSSRATEKSTVTLPHHFAQLYAPAHASDSVIAISSRGDIIVANADLAIQRTEVYPSSKSRLIKSFALEVSSCTFLPSGCQPGSQAITLFVETENKLRMSVFTVRDDIQLVYDEELDISMADIADISFASSGLTSILLLSGALAAYQVQLTRPPLSLRPLSSSINLVDFPFMSGKDKRTASILSLHSSFVLLTALTSESPSSLAVLLVDLNYSVVLAEKTVSVPSSLSPDNITIRLVSASPSQAIVSLCPSKATSGRAVILALPMTVPTRSTLADAMRCARARAKWISSGDSKQDDGLDQHSSAMLTKVKSSLAQNKVDDAEAAYSAWTKFGQQQQQGKQIEREVAQQLLLANLPSGKLHAPRIVKDLLDKNLVSNSMVEGGILPALLERKDWALVQSALKTVIDIPEADIISALRPVVLAHVNTGANGTNAMDVDAPNTVPPLPAFLALCVDYAVSAPALRLALRQHLSEAENVIAVMEVLDGWLDGSFAHERQLFLPEDERQLEPHKATPSVAKIVQFLRILIDSSFLALLQHKPARAMLQRLDAHLTPEADLLEELQELFAPLEMFAKANSARKAGARKEPGQADWRKRRKAAHERAAMNVGLYQIEELYM